MIVLHFTVPGEVRPWSRARLGKLPNGKPIHFTDAKTRNYEARWEEAAFAAMDGAAPMEGPLHVSVTARFIPPPSAPKKRIAAMLAGSVRPTRRPDLDNIVKNLDGLNGIAFKDDAQIVQLSASKVYAESAGVDVTIVPLGGAA